MTKLSHVGRVRSGWRALEAFWHKRQEISRFGVACGDRLGVALLGETLRIPTYLAKAPRNR
jgi:hypothetical protein